ncbi:MAG TPA: NAD(P)H-binding protein, partial [Desulfuromonadaceae bacterium]
MYVITGATGNIGSKTTDILLDRGEKVRVIGRNADRLRRFVERGAEAAVGNLKDTAFLIKAFEGADAAFTMIPPEYATTDFRAYQREIGTSIATAVEKSGIKYVVSLSSQGAELQGGTGPILGLREQEERLNRLHGADIMHLRPAYFMENLLMQIPLINRVGVAASAIRGDLKFAMIATRDIAAFVAERLVKRDFEGAWSWDLLGRRDVSLDEAFDVIGSAIARPGLKYVRLSYDEAAAGLREMGISADLARLFVEMSR